MNILGNIQILEALNMPVDDSIKRATKSNQNKETHFSSLSEVARETIVRQPSNISYQIDEP